MKRTITLVLVFVMILGISAMAADADPYSVTSNTITCKLDFTGGKAICVLNCKGKSNVTSINGVLTLRQINDSGTYTVIKTWTPSAQGNILSFSGSVAVEAGKTYCLEGTGVFFTSSGNERKDTSVSKTY